MKIYEIKVLWNFMKSFIKDLIKFHVISWKFMKCFMKFHQLEFHEISWFMKFNEIASTWV
jgi:hypothetical protein